ncbi:hypothetical protein D3C86_1305420 [compost metagenome]
MRLHRVAGVAQQHQAATAPERQRVAFEQRPLGDLHGAFDQRLDPLVPAVEGRAHLLDAARHPAPAHVPLGLGHAGHVVDLVELAGIEIHHHVAVVRPPLGAAVVREALDARDREHGAVRHVAGVLGRLGAQQVLADAGIDAVRADHDVGFLDRAVRERQLHHVAKVFHAFQLLVEGQAGRFHGVGHQGVEVATMHGQVARAVVRQRVVAQGDLGDHLAGLPVAAVPVVRVAAHLVHRILDADAPQDLHDIRPHVNAGAQPGEAWRLLIQLHVEPSTLEQGGRCRPAQACTNNRDPSIALHDVSPEVGLSP